jgi:hypothetical protein
MREVLLGLLLAQSLSFSAQSQTVSAVQAKSLFDAPLYGISFERGEEVSGMDAAAFVLPFQCNADGTVFFSVPLPPDPAVPFGPTSMLTSVSPSREVHSFPHNHIADLYDVRDGSYYASESKVVFLVEAAKEDKREMQTLTKQDGTTVEGSLNTAEHHHYALIFDREGKYQEAVQIDDSFQIVDLGIFPSETFLAYGYSKSDDSFKLALVKDDGRFIKFLEIPAGDAPKSALVLPAEGQNNGYTTIAPVQFVPSGRNIIVVQNKSSFPLLEVNEAGAIRPIPTKLPEGIQIHALIPSDYGLYARGNERDTVYELSPHDGTVIRRYKVTGHWQAVNLACVHDKKFLSFDRSSTGKLVPLFGSLEPIASPAAATATKQ